MARPRKTVDPQLTETVQKMTDDAIKAGLPVQEMTETVIDPAETVSVNPEIMDDMPVIIEPRTLTLEQKFDWNFEAMQVNLQTHVERYANLVVTEQNLKSMEKTQKEIAGLRTKLNKFRLAVKRDLEKPYEIFAHQVNQLLDLVQSVEKPLKDQLEKYEAKRREAKAQVIWGIIHQTAADLRLEEHYLKQMAVDEKWLNRTATQKEITEAIQERICWLLEVQAKDHQAALFAAQKTEMAKFFCQSLSVGLVTPVTYEEIERQIAPLTDMLAVKSFIENEVAQRKEREEAAAQAAAEQATPAATAPVPPPPMPPRSAVGTTWDVTLRLPRINMQQSLGFQKYLSDSGIRYEVLDSQEYPGDIP